MSRSANFFSSLSASETVPRMVVYHSNGLHEGIADGAADEAEASTPKILAQCIRFGREGRDFLEGVPAVYPWLSPDERPDIAVKRSKFLLNTEKGFRVTDCRFNLQSVSNDAGIVQEPFNAGRGIPCNAAWVEVVEGLAVRVTFLENGFPTQTCLRAFKNQEFK